MAKVFKVSLEETIYFNIEAESEEDAMHFLQWHTVGEIQDIAQKNGTLDECRLHYNETILYEEDDLIPAISILKGEK